ncbi:MAG: type II toxin-antitoxin system VapC family toxin [Xanthobacteraceae bacterium]
MILVDTSVWVDHLRIPEPALMRLLNESAVFIHPFVVGELALGNLRRRSVLDALSLLPQTIVATHDEAMRFIEQHRLFALGIGYVDVHLLAAARLMTDTRLWTRDKRLHDAADKLALAVKI